MLNGEKPETCRKCYQVEEAGGRSVRHGYLDYFGSTPDFRLLLESTGADGGIHPKVKSLDFSLSNSCNLKCMMCSPEASYGIKADFEKLGIEYNSAFAEGASKNWKNSDAIERIIPELSEHLSDFLTTGGEPFLSKPHRRILEIIVEKNKAARVSLSYHTNCTVKNEHLYELWKNFRNVRVHLSIDAFGSLNEYIRNGTNWAKLEKNVDWIPSHPKVHPEVHSCVQVLNIFGLKDLYRWIKTKPRIPRLPFHIWMHGPRWLHIDILPDQLKEKAYNELSAYFKQESLRDYEQINADQILSYLTRSLEAGQDLENFQVFKERIRAFEVLRALPQIESLVPELKGLI